MNGSPVANEFFQLAHHDLTGRNRLGSRTLGLGLAAALLGELVLASRIGLIGERLWVVDGAPPTDPLAHATLHEIVQEPHHREVRTWLTFLSHTAHDDVAQRMWQSGLVEPHASRRLLRGAVTTWVPTDVNRAAWPASRLHGGLAHIRPLSTVDVFLAGLADATGLSAALLDGAPGSATAYLQRLVAELPTSLSELLSQVEATVGEAVLSYRA